MFNPKEKANQMLDDFIMTEIVDLKIVTEEDIQDAWVRLIEEDDYELFNTLRYLVGMDYVSDYFTKAIDSLAKEII